jgi:hypothetical protein
MKRLLISIGTTIAVLLASNVVLAQGRGNAGGPKSKVTAIKPAAAGGKTTTTAKVNGPKVKPATTTAKVKPATAPKTTTAKAQGPKTKPATTTAKVKEPKSKPAATTAKVKEPKTKPAATTAKVKEPKSTTTTTTTTPAPAPTTTGTLTKVQEKLQSNTKLAAKLKTRLPEGTDIMKAAEGFRNLGQFVAAVNVSNNLGIDFAKLKTAMVDDGKSLGQAIQMQPRPDVDPTSVATRAEIDADVLIRSTESTPAPTTTDKTSNKAQARTRPTR